VLSALSEYERIELLTVHCELGLAPDIFGNLFFPDAFFCWVSRCTYAGWLYWYTFRLVLDGPSHIPPVVIGPAYVDGDISYGHIILSGLFPVGAIKDKALDVLTNSLDYLVVGVSGSGSVALTLALPVETVFVRDGYRTSTPSQHQHQRQR
jgi:hypothetical protein